MSLAAELDIPETGAIFTFGKSHFADNEPSHFFIKNDPVTKIYCGDDHTAVICQQGRVFAFGSNNYGQLGLGHTDTVERPACLKWLKPRKAKQVACGRTHSIILTENSQLYSTGDNSEGQLGTGCTESQLVPQFVEIAGEEENTVKQIGAGAEHSLALIDNGNVYGCGSNNLGQLGLGEELKNATSFTKIEIDKKIKLIACGYYHSVLITEEGEVYIFGDNENQRLGVSQTSAKVCMPTLISMGVPIMKAFCGHYHTFFLSENNQLFAVGSNEHGQLGLPKSVIEVNQPTEVNFDKLFDDSTIEAMSCGATHTAFVTENGYLFTCGDSTHSKLCLEENSEDLSNNNNSTTTQTNQYLPKRVGILEGFHVHDVACGGCHTIISAVKIVRNDNNNLVVENLESLPTTQTLPELPPLQKVPMSIMNQAEAVQKDEILTIDPEAEIKPMETIDTINGNDGTGKDKTSIDSLEPNVNGSHILEINDLHPNTEVSSEQTEQILIVEKTEQLSEDKNMLIKQETIVEIIEKTVVEGNKPVDIQATEGAIPDNTLQIPETVQYSPILSTKSETSQQASNDSENETIVCNSEKSTPLTKMAKTQAVIPILRTDEMVSAVETNAKIITDDCDVMHSKVAEQEGKISKFFSGSCMGKSKVISSVDDKEHEAAEIIGDQTNSRACVIL